MPRLHLAERRANDSPRLELHGAPRPRPGKRAASGQQELPSRRTGAPLPASARERSPRSGAARRRCSRSRTGHAHRAERWSERATGPCPRPARPRGARARRSTASRSCSMTCPWARLPPPQVGSASGPAAQCPGRIGSSTRRDPPSPSTSRCPRALSRDRVQPCSSGWKPRRPPSAIPPVHGAEGALADPGGTPPGSPSKQRPSLSAGCRCGGEGSARGVSHHPPHLARHHQLDTSFSWFSQERKEHARRSHPDVLNGLGRSTALSVASTHSRIRFSRSRSCRSGLVLAAMTLFSRRRAPRLLRPGTTSSTHMTPPRRISSSTLQPPPDLAAARRRPASGLPRSSIRRLASRRQQQGVAFACM